MIAPDLATKVEELYKTGFSSREVGNQLGLRPRQVRKYLAKVSTLRTKSEGQRLSYERHPERRIVEPTGLHTRTEFRPGHISPNRGKKIHTEVSKKAIGKASREQLKNPQIREILSQAAQKMWEPGGPLRLAFEQGRMVIPEEGRKRIAEASKRTWAGLSEEEKDERVKKCMGPPRFKPNRYEVRLGEILGELFPEQWKYVGNGEVVIGGKCPDFVNINGKKQIIELYGEYWHKGEDPKERINHFGRYGYSSLILWAKELRPKNTIHLQEKLLSFGNE